MRSASLTIFMNLRVLAILTISTTMTFVNAIDTAIDFRALRRATINRGIFRRALRRHQFLHPLMA